MKRILEIGPGYVDYFEHHHRDEKATITRVQDSTSIVEDNKAMQIADDACNIGGNKEWGLRHVASLPNNVLHQWARDGFIKNPQMAGYGDVKKVVDRLNNDPEWRYLKSVPWRI